MAETELPQNFLQHEDGDEPLEEEELLVEEYHHHDGTAIGGEHNIEYAEWPDGMEITENSEQVAVEEPTFVDQDGNVYPYAEYVVDGNGNAVMVDDVELVSEAAADEHMGMLVQMEDDQVEDEEDDVGHEYSLIYGQSEARRMITVVQCEICDMVIKHPSKIQAHMRTHSGEKPFECRHCGLRFTQKVPMLNHVRRHEGDMPFICSRGCGKRFVNNAQKNAHELRTHDGMKRRGAPRPHLKPPKRTFPNPIEHHYHNRRRAKMEETDRSAITEWNPSYGKIEQPMSAAASKRLDEVIESVAAGVPIQKKRHMQRKAAILAQCQFCGLMLKHPSKIQAHMRTHTGEKPYACGVCGMKFATLSPLNMHVKRKHSNNPREYECTWECGMRFVSIGARNEHERIVHAGIKRYECTARGCRRLFSRRCYLMIHRAREHPEQYEPVYDPAEVAQAEMEADAELVEQANAMNAYEELPMQLPRRVVHITSNGMVLNSGFNEGLGQHFLHDELDEEGEEATFELYEDDDLMTVEYDELEEVIGMEEAMVEGGEQHMVLHDVVDDIAVTSEQPSCSGLEGQHEQIEGEELVEEGHLDEMPLLEEQVDQTNQERNDIGVGDTSDGHVQQPRGKLEMILRERPSMPPLESPGEVRMKTVNILKKRIAIRRDS